MARLNFKGRVTLRVYNPTADQVTYIVGAWHNSGRLDHAGDCTDASYHARENVLGHNSFQTRIKVAQTNYFVF